MINKVLVANRGEIAVRIIRACREMGIETVAVYSEADQYSCHAQLADEAICIGPAKASESYLNPYNLLSAASVTHADALHPGYGFLAENAKFVGMCQKSGLTFIGPDAECMAKIGNKLQARKLAKAAGVPIIPGTTEPLKNAAEAVKAAERIGYPIMLKAVCGGGGMGIRRVNDKQELHRAFHQAQQEAAAAFGDGALYLEKVIDNARHVEVQVLFDHYGNGVHLFERECTLQRRNQKLIEEAPSAFLNDGQRRRLCMLAMRAAKAAGYRSAGTVEFLVDAQRRFYFMEINARVQVEHPVTEMVTGVDIIKQQIRIAAGERLGIDQRLIRLNGHAIECRINAEDAARNFAPSSGTVEVMHIPGGMDVRFDTYIYMNCHIPPYYDPMIGKLIVRDKTRDMAMAKMRSALTELRINGIETNIDFQIDLLTDERIIAGELDTGLIDRIMEE